MFNEITRHMKTLLTLLLCIVTSGFAVSDGLPEDELDLKTTEPAGEMSGTQQKVKSKDFSFTVNPYIWMMGATGTVGVPNTPSGYPRSVSFNETFADAVGNIKFAFMAGGKFKYKSVSLLYDIVYANMKAFDVANPSGQGLATGDVTLKEFVTDLALAYRIPSKSTATFVDVYAGTRIWAMDQEITLDPVDPNLQSKMFSNSNSWVDPLIGVKADFTMAKDWFTYVKMDFGGFGVSSDWTLMALAGCGYKFNQNWNTSLGIKYLGLEYNKDNLYLNVDEYGLALTLGYWY